MKRSYAYLVPFFLLGGFTLLALHCSDDPVCGNGVKEGKEQCDNGADNGAANSNCSASCTLTSIPRASIAVDYTRLTVDTPDFPNYPPPTCSDLGVASAHLVLTGPTSKDEKISCSSSSRRYDPVMPGKYQVTLTLLDASDQPVTKPVQSEMLDAQVNQPVTVNLTFQPSDYLKQDYRGTLYFLPSWGVDGQSCSSASIDQEAVKLTLPGSTTPVSATTSAGRALDGTASACFVKTSSDTYEKVENLAWGYYDLYLEGLATSTVGFCGKYNVFVGPGVANPTFALTVPASPGDGGACL